VKDTEGNSWSILKYYSSIFMKEMRKFIKHISEESLQINIEPKIYYI
jgi:hypothetical protein